MSYRYQLVDRIPPDMREGVVYHTEEFELAGLLCACGCGHRITLLVPDSHEVWDEGGYATIRPSIGVFDAPCKSHYVISAGHVHWLPAFTGAQAAKIMHSQIARHVARDAKPASRWQRAKTAVLRLLSKLRAFITR
ncbi:hypothetical protein A9K65_013580 [Mesorhizobium sp. WSM1497]|uniref:DUF6527 family protein n=1 Tax=unclassified Mesorhizobium TaxID=325217 RepID=UPI0003CE1239|nr:MULTISPECIES: DUF6527 family protein [unclassified Mesorhizobium]ARP64296.1 hypothetical protein A9K65_013580 [Mesorhizobium sp. WSM1497]ESX79380.1 hypothetical protein X757_03010 [Mesorhizobium sp. LSHC414A00]